MLSLKKVIIHSLINNKSRHRLQPPASKGADKLLFLFAVRDAKELSYYQDTIKTIEKYNIPYDVLVFVHDDMLRKVPVHYPNHEIIVSKDLSFWEVPNKEMETKLGRHFYKAVVNTFNGFLPVLDYAAAVIPSRARLTRYKENKMAAYNLRIDFENNGNEQAFIEHAIEYLKNIK